MSNRTIIDAVRAISGAGNPVASLHIGTVTAVDEDDYTCTCRLETGGGVAMPGVKLMPNPDDGVVGFPATGSQVLIILQSPGDAYVIMTTELDKHDSIANKEIYLHVDKSTLQLTPDKIVLNDGSYGGLVIADKLAEKYNALERRMNQLYVALNTWVPIMESDLKTKLAAFLNEGIIVSTTSDTLQNKDITHGQVK